MGFYCFREDGEWRNLKIQKVFNNNLASILDENGKEVLIMGKGIAFSKKVGDEVDEQLIDKRFYLENESYNDKLKQLLSDIPLEYFELANRIIDFARKSLDKPLSDSLYISLSDHIYTSVQRFKEGVQIKNPMLWEIQRYYEPEYEVGLRAIEMVKDTIGVELPEDEAGFITIHLVDASLKSDSIDQVYEITNVIQDITNIVRYFFNMEFDAKSVYYYRFITHIRFFAQRLILNEMYTKGNEDDLYHIIKEKYHNAYECVLQIEEYIKKKFDYEISNDEKLYLMIHIERMVYKSNQ